MHGGGDALRNCFLHVQGVSAVLKQLDLGQCRDKDLVTSLLNRQKCCVVSLLTLTRPIVMSLGTTSTHGMSRHVLASTPSSSETWIGLV